jgi:hypothetical protein
LVFLEARKFWGILKHSIFEGRTQKKPSDGAEVNSQNIKEKPLADETF